MPEIFFSLEEAQKMVEKIEPKAKRLADLSEEIEVFRTVKVKGAKNAFDTNLTVVGLNKNYHALMVEFYSIIEELSNAGCIVKDPKIGLMDFHSKQFGQGIFLCWKLGEKQISFWHELHAGFVGRKPISSLIKQ